MTTSEAMKRAKAKYYEKNKEKIAEQRNEHCKLYNARRVETEDARQAFNEYQRNYRLRRKETTSYESNP